MSRQLYLYNQLPQSWTARNETTPAAAWADAHLFEYAMRLGHAQTVSAGRILSPAPTCIQTSASCAEQVCVCFPVAPQADIHSLGAVQPGEAGCGCCKGGASRSVVPFCRQWLSTCEVAGEKLDVGAAKEVSESMLL